MNRTATKRARAAAGVDVDEYAERRAWRAEANARREREAAMRDIERRGAGPAHRVRIELAKAARKGEVVTEATLAKRARASRSTVSREKRRQRLPAVVDEEGVMAPGGAIVVEAARRECNAEGRWRTTRPNCYRLATRAAVRQSPAAASMRLRLMFPGRTDVSHRPPSLRFGSGWPFPTTDARTKERPITRRPVETVPP